MRLKQIMTETGVTQRQVAEAIGVTEPALNHYINGRREPDIATLVKLADYFDVSIDYLVGRDVPEERPMSDKAIMTANGQNITLDPSKPVQFNVNGKVFELILAEEKEPVQVFAVIVRSHAEKRCYAAIFSTSADDHGMPIYRFYHAKVCDKVCDNPLTHAAALSIIIVTVRAFPFSDIYFLPPVI